MCTVVISQRVSFYAGKYGAALSRPAAVLSAALQQALLTLKPQSVQDFGNGAQSGAAVLAGINTKCCKLRVRPSNSTSTPRRSDGFFLSYIFGAICESFSFLFEESIHCLLQGELLYIFLRFCGSAF